MEEDVLITKIYIATHKPYWLPSVTEYQPIHVGAANTNNRFVETCDNIGTSISDKNRTYCELTGLYWIWKNDKTSETVGFCHYRRYFDFKHDKNIFLRQCIMDKDFKSHINNFISPVKVENYLKNADVVLPTKHELGCTIQEQYYSVHSATDFKIMQDVVRELYPDYTETMNRVFNCKRMYPYNMFIMKKSLFDDYMGWVFSVLFEVEKRITIAEDPYQSRVIGFLAERLLNVYVYHHKLKIKEIPIVFIDEQSSRIKYEYKKKKYVIRDLFKQL